VEPDRRTSSRRKVSLAAEIETADGPRSVAVSRDASDRGVLLLTHVAPAIGSTFRIHVVHPLGGAPIVVSGRVVRCERLELDLADVWSFKVGVELVDAPKELATLLDDLASVVAG
jgi:hypothetical protein